MAFFVARSVAAGAVLSLLVMQACAERAPAAPSTPAPVGSASPVPSHGEAASLPPPGGEPDAGPGQCSADCKGEMTPELEADLSLRMKMTHRCYDRALARDATLRGRIDVALVVGTDGRVCRAQIAKDGVGNAELAACVRSAFERATFSAPIGDCVKVTAPIVFAGIIDAGVGPAPKP